MKKHVIFYLLSFTLPVLLSTIIGCGSGNGSSYTAPTDTIAMGKLQGLWIDEESDDFVFMFKKDSVYFSDKTIAPAHFTVEGDTLRIYASTTANYFIKDLDGSHFSLINMNGDEINLIKSKDKYAMQDFMEAESEETDIINQGKLIKRDSVVTAGDARYHIYTQINPTSYKVIRRQINENGISVDNVFYDNIIHIAIYDGNRKVISRDYRKKDFAKHVPEQFLENSILSDILIKGSSKEGVHLTVIIASVDLTTSYRITLTVDSSGKISMAI